MKTKTKKPRQRRAGDAAPALDPATFATVEDPDDDDHASVPPPRVEPPTHLGARDCVIRDCQITATNAPANEHTRGAIEALAKACEANAAAIAACAHALRGSDVRMDAGIRLGG